MSNNTYEETGYKRVVFGATRCSNGLRGFRVNIRKLSIQRLRVRFMKLFKVFFKWRKSYERAVKSLRKGISGGRYKSTHNHSQTRLISAHDNKIKPDNTRLRSLGRTNSFYSEAIADCLEFIKRNSLSVDDPRDQAAPLAAALR